LEKWDIPAYDAPVTATPRYRTFAPIPALRSLVDEIWVQEGEATPGAAPTAILPAGRVDLVLNWSDPFVEVRDGAELAIPQAAIVGPRTRPWKVRATGRCGLIIVCFHPWATGTLFGSGVASTTDTTLSVGDVFGSCGERRLLACAEAAGRVQRTQQLLQRWLEDRAADRAIIHATRLLHGKSRRKPVQRLASELGISRRHLQRRITEATGLTPKKLSSLARVHRAIGRLRRGESESSVACRCGYSDQSHLIREVRAFTGATPAGLRRTANGELVETFNRESLSRYL
jgi:AraC-like DNA-binding protein